MDDELDDDLLSQFLPGSTVPQGEGVKKSAPKVGAKRVFSAVEQVEGMADSEEEERYSSVGFH